jgi:hypothetical protein
MLNSTFIIKRLHEIKNEYFPPEMHSSSSAKYLLSFVSWFKITFYAPVAPGIILPAIVFQWNVK